MLKSRFVLLVICMGIAQGQLAPRMAFAYTQSQFDGVTTEEQAQVGRVRDQEISQLKIVMGRRFAENRRPDILLRLAELYIEKYRFYFFKENEIHQQQYKQGLRPKLVNHDRSREYLRAATHSCLAILKSRVSSSKLDEVYYFLGYNAEEMGNRREAVKYFGVVASRYPNSNYAPEAYRNLAEAAFDEGTFSKALAYYERAAQYTKVPSFPRTLYKLAWAYFKTRRRGDALSTMKRVIEAAGKEDKFVGLRDEAMNDIVLFFSEAGRLAEAHDYFSSFAGGPEVYTRALGKLSTTYEKRGDYKLALRVNEGLISEYGDQRPDLIYDALGRNVELYRKLGDGAGEERALSRLVDFFAKHRGQIAKGEEGEATYARAKNYLRSRATDVHKEARKQKSDKLFSRAADLYSLYIRAFLQNPANEKEQRELTEIRTYRSDALLASGRELDAIPELERTLADGGDSKLRHEAGTTLLNLLIKRVDAAKAKGKDAESAEKQFLKDAEVFSRAFPEDKLTIELRYKRARLAAGRAGPEGLSGEARDILQEFIEKYPGRPESAEAAHDLVSDLIKRKRQEDATKLAQTYLANPSLLAAGTKSSLEAFLRSVVERKEFTDVAKIEQSSDYSKAALGYEQLARSAKDAEVAYKSYNNAAVNFDRASMVSEAVRVYQLMLAKWPSNSAPREELKRLAANLLWKSRFSEAAGLYSKLASLPAYSRDERMSFMRTAFSLSWGVGDLPNAYLIGSRGLRELCGSGTIRKGKKPAAKASGRTRQTHVPGGVDSFSDGHCHELAMDLAYLQIEAGRATEAIAPLRAYAERASRGTRRAEAYYLLGELYGKLHEQKKSTMYYEEAARAVARAGKGRASQADARERNFAAHAAFLIVEPLFARFMALKLELPEERLKSITRKKLSDLEDLVTRYTGVVAYGDGEWGIAALERLHDLFAGFAAELESAPIPEKYQGPTLEAYKRGIQSVTAPMNARAVDYLKQGYQKGLQLGVTSPTFVALTQRLSKRAPREYPPAHYAMVQGEAGAVRQSALRLSGPSQDVAPESLKQADHPWRAQIAARLAANSKSADAWVELGNLEALTGRLRLSRLLYEQAISLNPKHAQALCNLSVVLFLENRPIEATQGFLKAAEIAEFSRDIRLNLAKSFLAFHHYAPALEHLRGLSARSPQDLEVQEAMAVALLGSAQFQAAAAKLESLDAEGSKRFNLWYNHNVWAVVAGDKERKSHALELLKERREGLSALEKIQVEVLMSIAGAQGGM